MKYIFTILLFLILFTSCNKVVTIQPDFDVITNSNTYKVGDTITFNLSGKSNYLVFYSGEFGKEYKYSTRGYLTGGKPIINFTSTVSGTILPDTLLRVLLSTNFTGTNSVSGISSASWTDITNRVSLSNGLLNNPSGSVDISDLVNVDSLPVTLAFRYRIPAKRITNWTIQNLTVNTVMIDGYSVPIYNLASGFTAVDFLNTAIKWTTSTSSISTSGSSTTSTDSEDWVVSKPFFPYRITMDQGVVIKSIADVDLKSFTYKFITPGKYTVTFVSKNSNVYDTKELIKSIDLNITP